MRITLRSLLLTSAFIAAAAFTTRTATAETLRVPFEFTLYGKTLPAGLYNVHRDIGAELITMEGPERHEIFTWMLVPGDANPSSNAVKMSFTKDGSQYALHTIQYRAYTTFALDKNKSKHSTVRYVSGQ